MKSTRSLEVHRHLKEKDTRDDTDDSSSAEEENVDCEDKMEKMLQECSMLAVKRVKDMDPKYPKILKKYANVPEVGVAVKMISIYKLDMSAGSFDARFNLNIAWKGDKGDTKSRPEAEIYNAMPGLILVEGDTKEGCEGWDWFYRIRVSGSFRQDYHLRRFPFDHQDLGINVRMKKVCKLVNLPWGPNGEACSCDPRCLMEEYVLTGFRVRNKYMPSHKFGHLEGYDPEVSLVFIVGRKSLFWFMNYGLLSSAITSLMCTAYAIPHTEIGDRLGVATTLLLTLIAMKLLMMDKLPVVSYFTLLDYHMAVCICVLALMTADVSLPSVVEGGEHAIIEAEDEWLKIVASVWVVYNVIALVSALKWTRLFKYSRMRAPGEADSDAEN